MFQRNLSVPLTGPKEGQEGHPENEAGLDPVFGRLARRSLQRHVRNDPVSVTFYCFFAFSEVSIPKILGMAYKALYMLEKQSSRITDSERAAVLFLLILLDYS